MGKKMGRTLGTAVPPWSFSQKDRTQEAESAPCVLSENKEEDMEIY